MLDYISEDPSSLGESWETPTLDYYELPNWFRLRSWHRWAREKVCIVSIFIHWVPKHVPLSATIVGWGPEKILLYVRIKKHTKPSKGIPMLQIENCFTFYRSPGWHYKTGPGWMASRYKLDAWTGGADGKSSHSSWLPLNLKKLSVVS